VSVRVILLIFIIPFYSSAQSQWNGGIEPQMNYNYSFGKDDKFMFSGLNAFVKYSSHELYFGFNTNNALLPDFSKTSINVTGFDCGIKYHFASLNRISHFFSELNIQRHRYIKSICTSPRSINFPSTGEEHCHVSKCTSTNIHLAAGYETFFTKRISLPLSFGGGISRINTTSLNNPAFPATSGISWIFSPFVKVALRVYVGKNEVSSKADNKQ